jgi:Amt family ammonium transporter
MNWMLSILHVEPSMLQEFIAGVQKELDYIENIFENGKDYREILINVYRSMHLIKGNAGLLALEFFADQAHQFEDLISEVQKQKVINKEDLNPLVEKLGMMRVSLSEVHGLLDRIGEIHTQMRPKRRYEQKILIQSLNNLLGQMCKDRNKKVRLDIADFQSDELPQKQKLVIKESLVQFMRNAISHGIESPSERKAAKKPETGVIQISSFRQDNYFGIRFRDDGRGIQLEELRKKAIESGKWPEEEILKWDKDRVLETIYISGISTTTKVDILSGRGVGLDGVREKLKQHQGEISVKFKEGVFTEFTLLVPLESN